MYSNKKTYGRNYVIILLVVKKGILLIFITYYQRITTLNKLKYIILYMLKVRKKYLVTNSILDTIKKLWYVFKLNNFFFLQHTFE